VKFIGKIGGTKAVYGHFIERPENLQGAAEGVIGTMLSVLSGGYGAEVTVRWVGEATEMVVRRRIPNSLATMSVERSVPGRFHTGKVRSCDGW
jgi:hypothetical protein